MSKQKGLTEAEWLAATSPLELFAHIRGLARTRRVPMPQRRCRLFGCACCRLVWEQLTDERSRNVVEASERFADGRARKSELARADRAAAEVAVALKLPHEPRGLVATGRHPPQLAAEMAVWVGHDSIHDVVEMTSLTAGSLVQALQNQPTAGEGTRLIDSLRRLDRVFREIFGNPFRPASIDRQWLTWNEGFLPRLAEAIYEDRLLPSGELDRMRLAVLADALEEAGCQDAVILGHCRLPGTHTRGCWVVDQVLGKE